MRICTVCGQVIRNARPRTTGPRSQSAHLHGHLQVIAAETGYTMGEMKQVMKEDMPTWPTKAVRFRGREYVVAVSEADVDTETESAAIEWCHQQACELGIVLRED